ncbi:hypothetical protein MATL_G00044300 [Megalops atlanticus]|uniref:PH domain-containing protein n=1 Tax=Megalops atlanticus TaxID=7932 RepID=A0A9D3QEY1_MEGAT|nr:hypothetical protein MATL_G00044300 [Megalops atlanticus]
MILENGAVTKAGRDEDTAVPVQRSLSVAAAATTVELDKRVAKKMLMTRDTARDEAQKLHRKWQKHQAFMAELAQNKEWLQKIEKEGQQLIQEKPELSSIVQRKLEEIRECWLDLESSTQAKAHQLFEANKTDLVQGYAHLDGQLSQVGQGRDLVTVNRQLRKLQTMESPMEGLYKELGDLHMQGTSVPQQTLTGDDPSDKQAVVETRIVRLIEPLKERRRILLATKEVHQVTRDLEDEILWVQERLPMATCKDPGNTLAAVQLLMQKNESLQRDLHGRQPRIEDVMDRAALIASIRSPEADFVREGLERLRHLWGTLCLETERRQIMLDTIHQAQQYYSSVAEVEAWLCKQERLMMNEDKGKDEASTLELLKKHLVVEQTIEDYAERIGLLSQHCRQLLELGHPDSEQISKQQSQVDRLYVSLKDLVEERKSKLEQQYWLYQLSREVEDLEQWISEREVVASSHELGQDLEHVTMLQEKFTEFSSETRSLGQERVTAVNKMVDELIDYGHVDAATIAEWKDGLSEAWADLLEMMETRGQMLAASHQLHKFFANCREALVQIEEKKRRLSELQACQAGSANTSTLQRLMHTFEHDIQLLVTQVRQLQESASQLRTVYAGEKAEAIALKEQEMMQAWAELLTICDESRVQITTVSDKLRFFSMVRDLSLWMDGLICQIGTGETPRDVSSVEVLMNYHQSLKSDIEARNKSVMQCMELGKTLLAARNPAAEEVKEKLDKLMAKQKELSDKWDKQWEELQRMLEEHQYSRDAVVAEAWLTGQEPFISRKEVGGSVDEVEQLIRRHEAFRKAAATWEEHFSSLRRLNTVERLTAKQSSFPSTPLLGRKVFLDPQETSPIRRPTSSLLRQTIYEQMEPKPRQVPLRTSSVAQRLGSTVANYTPIMNWSSHRALDVRSILGDKPASPLLQQPPTPDHLQPKIEIINKAPAPPQEVRPVEPELERRSEFAVANVVVQEPGRDLFSGELSRDTRGSRSDPQMDRYQRERERRLGRQTSSEQEIKARWEELPLEVREHRYRRRMERQTSSEQEGQTLEGSRKSSEQDTTRESSDKRSGGEKRSTMAEIVEQLQEREAAQARGETPRLSNGILDRVTRPDRPRARDRPKPRRRPRPKEPTESRRSRSAPAKSNPAVPQPPTHSAQHEGFLFRKHDVESQKKSTNRSWVNLYCVLSKGELGFYKDAKNTATPYNSEPLLNLSSCTCDVTNGYKKKKNVFTLKTTEGNEFLFHAKDEEDLKTWVSSITASIAEHEEIAKWGKPQATTSSTDEGTRRDGDKSEKAEKSDRGEAPEESEKPKKAEKAEKAGKAEKVEKAEKAEKVEKAERAERAEKTEKSDRHSSTSGKTK